jgi:predicted ATP-binding protein involved in virulence
MTELKKSSEGFYFLSLSLENVRCFGAKQTLDLSDGNGRPAQWTVILGDNGTGKTTLLEILAKGICVSDSFPNSLRRINTSKAKILSGFAFNSTLVNAESNFINFKLQTELFDRATSGRIIPYEEPNSQPDWHPVPFQGGEMVLYAGGFSISNSMFFSIAYSASRRLKSSSPFLYGNSAVNESTNEQGELVNAEKWLLDTDYIASKESEIQENYKKRFEIIKAVLINLLPDVEGIRITVPSEKSPNPRVEFKLPDGWLLLSQLSLGYQTMTAWMVDLATRLFNFYPDSPNPIAEPAIVLIDEIDLHLHPKWQRTIMSYLSERFINTQFIVTAHSPLIVQAAENANIVVLKRENDNVIIQQQHKDIQGWRVDQLLASDLFGLSSSRSVKYEELLNKRRAILSKAKLTAKDKKELKELELEMGDLPTAETPEDIKAMDIIRRAAKLLESET